MKKGLLFASVLISFCLTTHAENPKKKLEKSKPILSAKDGTCFDENTKIINIGVGFGGGNYYNFSRGGGYTYRSSPAFSASYEQAFPKKLGIGFLGLGAYVGFRTSHSRYENYYYSGTQYYYEHRWNYFMVAARGVYHFDVLNAKNAEVYCGVLAGARITTYNYETNSSDPNKNSYRRSDGGLYPVASLFVGARWYFVPKVAVYSELGYGVSYITAGISFKF